MIQQTTAIDKMCKPTESIGNDLINLSVFKM